MRICILIASIWLSAAAGSCMQNHPADPQSELKESSMNIETDPRHPATAIPPIDAVVPAQLESASFGLG